MLNFTNQRVPQLRTQSKQCLAPWALLLTTIFAFATPIHAQQPPTISRNLITPATQKQIDLATDNAISWLLAHQLPDGSFAEKDSPTTAQPALTSLVTLALLSRNHVPTETTLDKAIRYVLSCQRPDGLISLAHPDTLNQPVVWYHASHTAIYNHAISALLLTEVFGQTDPSLNRPIQTAIEQAIQFTLKQYPTPKRQSRDEGGWRYLAQALEGDGDISVTSWQLLFLRSAKNAGYDIPGDAITRAHDFVNRCYDRNLETFLYMPSDPRSRYSRATTAAGILSLSLLGQHQTDIAITAGNWLIQQPLHPYNTPLTPTDRYHYSLFYAAAATYQLGGKHFNQFYPNMVDILIKNQKPNGSWQRESHGNRIFGSTLTTSLSILALTIPDETLPIFQR